LQVAEYESTHLLHQFSCTILSYRCCQFFEERARKRFDKVKVERFIKRLLKILRYPTDVGECWRNEIDCWNIGK